MISWQIWLESNVSFTLPQYNGCTCSFKDEVKVWKFESLFFILGLIKLVSDASHILHCSQWSKKVKGSLTTTVPDMTPWRAHRWHCLRFQTALKLLSRDVAFSRLRWRCSFLGWRPSSWCWGGRPAFWVFWERLQKEENNWLLPTVLQRYLICSWKNQGNALLKRN